jgi:hypothetical protein
VASPGGLTSLPAWITSITTRGLSAHLHSDGISCHGHLAMASVLRRSGNLECALQHAPVRLRERLPSRKPPWPANVDASAAERDLLKKYVEASESADFRAFESIIRADATFRMPPDFGAAEGRDEMFKLWVEEGFGSERFGRLHCVVTHANLQPAVAAYVRRPGDSTCPSFHVPFFFPALMLRVPRPCVLRKGGYDAADRIGSNGSFESIEPKRFTVGSPVSALRNVREGRGTHN